MRRLLCALAAPVLVGALGGPALAQDARPPTARRMVQAFDFEEEAFNPEPVPRYWYRAQNDPEKHVRPGFPLFNRAAFDTSQSVSGTHSVVVPTAGGSTSLRLIPGIIPVLPGADYVVSAKVRTSGMIHSRAFLRVRFLDERREPIPGAEANSGPIRSPGAWTEALVQLHGIENASFLQVDLEVLQPEQFRPRPIIPAADVVWSQDFDARAWFDDVILFQVPRISLTTGERTGVIVGDTPPDLDVSVRDMVGEHLDARLIITDLAGRIVDEQRFPADPSGRVVTRTAPLQRYGWYRALLSIEGPAGPVGLADVRFLWLPEPDPTTPAFRDPPSPDRQRFALNVEGAPADRLDLLPALVARTGAGSIAMDAYAPAIAPDAIETDFAARRPVIDQLLADGVEITLALTTVPEELAALHHLDRNDPLELARLDPRLWTQYLLPTLDLFGQRITRWRLGPAGSDAPFWNDDLAASVARLGEPIRRLVPGPTLGVPWSMAFDPAPLSTLAPSNGPDVRTGALSVAPVGFSADEIARSLARWLAPRRDASAGFVRPDMTILLDTPPPSQVDHPERVAQLAQRTISAWSVVSRRTPGSAGAGERTGAPSIALSTPWLWPERPDGVASPAPELGAWRTLVERLAGRRVIATLPAHPGLRCFVLAEPSGQGALDPRGAIAAWNDSAPPDEAFLMIHPGLDAPLELIDLFGNRTRLAEAGQVEPVRVALGPTPVFIEGIDPYLAAFLAGFHIEPEFVPSLIVEHQRELVITNPWPMRISGLLQIVEPGPEGRWPGWTFSPRAVQPFSLAPGQSATLPIMFSFGPGEEAGAREIVSVVRLTAERPYPPMRIGARIEIGLKDLDVAADVRLAPGPNGPDVVVAVRVTNAAQDARTLVLRAAAPGQPSQQIPISNLPPHAPTTRQFVFPGAAAALSGKKIRIGLDDVDTPGRLNTSVVVP